MNRAPEDLNEEHLGRAVRKNRPKKKPVADNPGRPAVVINVSVKYCMVSQNGEVSRVRYEIPVAPGDEVTIRNEKVLEIAPRRTTLSRTEPSYVHKWRVIAANIDYLLIVAAMANPPFRPGLVDRYLIAASRGGIHPILCVNKTDLTEDVSAAAVFEIPTVFCSTVTGQGIDQLRDMIAGSTAVLAGHSGVGKSSLLNALASEDKARIGEVDEDTGQGKHTTTNSRLYELSNGARIIDTPGIREFGLGKISMEEIQAAFPEFMDRGCRFRDCSHRDDPDCAVREMGGPRYASYLRLMGEL